MRNDGVLYMKRMIDGLQYSCNKDYNVCILILRMECLFIKEVNVSRCIILIYYLQYMIYCIYECQTTERLWLDIFRYSFVVLEEVSCVKEATCVTII